jgi:hypothetical protein
VSSQIYDHLCVWKFSLNSKLLGDKDCLHWIWPVKKITPFPFTFPYLCFLYFYILLLLMPVSGSVLLYAGAHKISLKYLFPEKMFIEICCQKCQKCNTICVTSWQPFSQSPIHSCRSLQALYLCKRLDFTRFL